MNWRQELHRLGAAAPSTDLWSRALEGPRLPQQDSPNGVRRVVLIAALLALVLVGVGLPLRLLWPLRHQEVGPASGPSASSPTAQLSYVSITYPGNWALYEGPELASPEGPYPQAWAAQLTNFDPGIRSTPICQGSIDDTPSNGAGLVVAVNPSGGWRGVGEEWPVALNAGASDWTGPPCAPPGAVESATWQVPGGASYSALAWFGDDASPETREEMEAAFASMKFPPTPFRGSLSGTATRVIASGVYGGGRWSITGWVERSLEGGNDTYAWIGLTSQASVYPGSSHEGGSMGEFDTPGSDALAVSVSCHDGPPIPPAKADTAPTLVWGAAPPAVSRIEVRAGSGATRATMVPFPRDLGTTWNAFYVGVPKHAPGHLVALDSAGAVLDDQLMNDGYPCAASKPMADPRPVIYPTNIPQPSPEATEDEATQSNLRDAMAAAKTYFTDGDTYEGFGPAQGVAIEPTLPWDTSPAASVGVISIRDVSPTTVLLVSASVSGKTYCLADDDGRTTYGTTDARTAAECAEPIWPG